MKQTRRNFIKTAGVASLLVPLSLPAIAKIRQTRLNSFVVPALDRGIRKGNNVSFKLAIQAGKTSFFNGVNTPTLGLNQSYLGPVLRAKRGDTVSINVSNHINEVTTVHWHGMTLPANMDGGPHQAIPPNKTWTSRFQIRQEAGTLWYHSHAMHKTGPQVYHGLAGMFILDDEGSDKLGLPNEYGVDDIPCTIQDRRFNQDGSFSYMSMMPDRMMGMMGSIVLVNGVVTPTLVAKKTLLRLRLHNGSNARTYNLAFSDGRPFHVIASDCGFLHKPFQTNQVRLAVAERVEILVDVSDRKEVLLKSLASSAGGMMGMMPMMQMNNKALNIMTIDARQAKQSARKVPAVLRNSTLNLNPKAATATRQFELEMGMMGRGGMGGMMGGMMNRMDNGGRDGMFRINGKSMDINRIDFQVKANSTEIWEISNASPMAHPFHVHNVQFRILDRNGKRPHPSESGLKDVVLVHGNERVRIIMKFPEYSDAKVPYMYHCHILEHEDQGMMGQFVVV
ncbi:MAG: multicopper oxidase domain-containing protein [Cocleimonas sp.]|nr:multicopper oxidase domain-containing protein [Cocleimonas sp.]